MLGEDHSLILEFPEYKKLIAELIQTDRRFAGNAKSYSTLDTQIRALELDGSPIDDKTMHQMKAKRAELKDLLYRCLSKQS